MVGLSSTFISSLAKLEASVQKRAINTLIKFQKEPMNKGLNLEKITNDFWSIRVDLAYRIILHQKDPSIKFVFVWIDHHDDAYAWANTRSIELNDDIVQIVDQSILEIAHPHASGLYSHVSDFDLQELSIPSVFFPVIRSIQNENELSRHKEFFHPYIFESLKYLADPSIPVSEIIALQRENNTQAGDIEAITEPSDYKNRQTIVHLRDSFDLQLLEERLNSPLNDWKLFLHPTQSRIVAGEFNGPVKVLGGAGTGKTVVLVHRAKYLAKKAPAKKILITTFTKNLTNDIAYQVRSICKPKELEHIEIKNIDSLIAELFYRYWPNWRLTFDDKELNQLWEQSIVTADIASDFPISFFQEEWSRVIIPQNIQDARDYVNADRKGRGLRLSRKNKYELWEVFSQFKSTLEKKELSDVYYALQCIIKAVQADYDYSIYSSVLVDETQDFDEIKLTFLRVLAGKEHKNDMFLVGDSRQKIYRKAVVLNNCGINVTARRSFRLRINYRTTEEIRSWAYKLFKDHSVDDLDAEYYKENRYISLISGPQPTVNNFSSTEKEIEGIFDYITNLKEKHEVSESYDNICLTFRRRTDLSKYKKELEKFGFQCYEVKTDSLQDDSFPGIRFATLHRAKGLEFDHVIICAVNDGIIPNEYAISQATDPVMKREIENSERNLLYVAATRARKTLCVFSHGKPSRFLKE